MNGTETIIAEALALSWIDWVVTITALIYVVLAARENSWCWFWGIISCALWAYASFVFYQLYLDAVLQLFYVGMGFAGIYQWQFGGTGKRELPIRRMKYRDHLFVFFPGVILALVFGYFFGEYTQAAATYLDAFTTVFSIIATFLLVRKLLENWLYWVIIDAFYIYLYLSRGAYLFALVMGIYVLIALFAFQHWFQHYRSEAGKGKE